MHATATVGVEDRIDLRALWRALATDPASPDRFELTEHGELVLSPLPTNRHQMIVGELVMQLRAQLGGAAAPNLAVLTRNAGVRCSDVAWLPEARVDEAMADGPLESMPPLLVEVLSPGNRRPEMAHKLRGYLDSGAQEVVVVGLDGGIVFHRLDGAHGESMFGLRLELPRGAARR